MILTIKNIDYHGSDRMTSQYEYIVEGDIDGEEVKFSYLDCGNNADYEEELFFEKGNNFKYEEAVFDFLSREISTLIQLAPGESIGLTKEAEEKRLADIKMQQVNENLESLSDPKTKRPILVKPIIKF